MCDYVTSPEIYLPILLIASVYSLTNVQILIPKNLYKRRNIL